MKTIVVIRKTRHRGRAFVEWFFVLTATAYNLIRIPRFSRRRYKYPRVPKMEQRAHKTQALEALIHLRPLLRARRNHKKYLQNGFFQWPARIGRTMNRPIRIARPEGAQDRQALSEGCRLRPPSRGGLWK